MFRTRINSTAFTSDVANDIFGQISGIPFGSDYSLLSTMRALVYPRIKDTGECINIQITNSGEYYKLDTLNSVTNSRFNNFFLDAASNSDAGKVTLVNLNGDDEAIKYIIEKADEQISIFPGWKKLQKVSDFYRKTFKVGCYISEELQSTILLVENLVDMRVFHYLQCSIFAFLPWFFDPKVGVTEDEMALINSLRERTPEKYEEAISKLAEQYDFRTLRINKYLDGFETKALVSQKESLINKIENIMNQIETLDRRISEYIKEKSDVDVRIMGINEKILSMEEDTELKEYFLCNDKLQLEEVSGDTLTFTCWNYLEYFDEDIAETVINNKHSFVYVCDGRKYDNVIPQKDMEKFMRAVFLDGILKIRFCAAYSFGLNGYVHGIQGYKYDGTYNKCMRNPHIDRYSCLGNYERVIDQFLIKGDYISAIEQCIASVKSLNFGDSVVMEKFVQDLYGISGNPNVCVELPDGRVVNPKDAIEYLKSQEQQENVNEDIEDTEEVVDNG